MKNLQSELLNAVSEALTSVGNQMSLPLLLTVVAVAQNEGLSINDLSEKTGFAQQTASRYVSILQGRYEMPGNSLNAFQAAPLVSLEISSNDPRRRALFLTPHGKEMISELISKLYGHNMKAPS